MPFSQNDFKYIDSHCHFFPPKIFNAIWKFFEKVDEEGNIQGWPINYKLSTESLVRFLESQNIKKFTTYNYAHKRNVADSINEWVHDFCKNYEKAIPFGCVWPEDKDRIDYTTKILDDYAFLGIKIQPLVQEFYPDDERLYEIYNLLLDRGKWICFHAGTAPYPNKYVGYKNFNKFLERYPDMNIIVAHMGAFEYGKFLKLLDTHENLYLDTTMIYIPNNIFPERIANRPNSKDLQSYQDRILFGSDFPNIPYEYKLSTEGLLNLDLPKDFYNDIFFENAKRIFKIRL
ncbi:MAG: amidohydrolase family protein [Promethearchaeota archaeon]|jgi:predicted TIM-barrel fold metal-dependent hydrolase